MNQKKSQIPNAKVEPPSTGACHRPAPMKAWKWSGKECPVRSQRLGAFSSSKLTRSSGRNLLSPSYCIYHSFYRVRADGKNASVAHYCRLLCRRHRFSELPAAEQYPREANNQAVLCPQARGEPVVRQSQRTIGNGHLFFDPARPNHERGTSSNLCGNGVALARCSVTMSASRASRPSIAFVRAG